MRGKGYCLSLRHPLQGITPAYAGKSDGRGCGRHRLWDHPRVCGEKRLFFADDRPAKGSPPRMRGKEKRQRSSRKQFRITPAYAGKSPAGIRHGAAGRDHPRVCGEKQLQAMAQQFQQGSPPRMRGKARSATHKSAFFRITPAYAGKSFKTSGLLRA